MTSYLRLLALTAAVACLQVASLPQALAEGEGAHHGHEGHAPAAATPAPAAGGADSAGSAAAKDYQAAMDRMHQAMSEPLTGDVDVDFVKGMIPHHQGAIDQAQILLKYSKNPRLRRLAGGIIAAQRREIRFMQAWLKERAAGAETDDMPDWLKNTPIPSAEETTATTPKP